ncbi:hypothetical protein StoSoilB13_18140 [Arthrobacter sp. StoSoilB13]|nr:hypothetical protein StoSoilB13_18140 [Arthrobacter sp. StoSoilB13]
MSATMQAAVVTEFGTDLTVKEVERPTPGPGQALVRLIASGVCHTDLHAAEGDWPVKPTPPFIPGHEGVGEVVALGEGVTDVAVGDLVGNAWLWSACGDCQYCRTGWETLCESQQNGGYSVDGSFGEYMLVDTRFAARIPEGSDPVEVAPVLCAGVTVYKGLKMTEAQARSMGHDLRYRGPGPHRGPVCGGHGAPGRGSGHCRRQVGACS